MRAAGHAWSGRSTLTLSGGASVQATVRGRIPSTDIFGHSTLAGSVTATSNDLARLALTGARLGLWDPAAPSPEAGRATVTLWLAGTIAAPSARGGLRLDEGRIAGVGPIAGSLNLAVQPGHISADTIEVALGDNHLTGHASLRGSPGTLAGSLDLSAGDFRVLGETVAGWRPSGGLHARADLSGHGAGTDRRHRRDRIGPRRRGPGPG